MEQAGHSRQWEDSKPRGSTEDNEVDAGTLAVAEVEVVDDRDKNQGRAVADNAARSAAAHATWDSGGAVELPLR